MDGEAIETICFANDIPYPNGIISATLSHQKHSGYGQERVELCAIRFWRWARPKKPILPSVRTGNDTDAAAVVVFMLPFQRNAIDKNLWHA